jgi:hypothetical protein
MRKDLLYGRTVIQPYVQAQKSANLGHSGSEKWEKASRLNATTGVEAPASAMQPPRKP